MTRLLLILCLVFVCDATAKLYSQAEIEKTLNNPKIQLETQDFITAFFVAKNPQRVLNDLLHNKSFNALESESQLNALLSEVSRQVRQPFLQKFVTQMQNYSNQAFKMHEEGRLTEPVFNLNAKAKGIENIWAASDALHKYTQLFNNQPIDTLQQLSATIDLLNQPEWLGLKQSLDHISDQSRAEIKHYFMVQAKNTKGLDKFISRFVLKTADRELAVKSLETLDSRNKQYLLRHLPDVFTEDFVIEQLLQTVRLKDEAAFALTLLKPYVKEQRVQTYLIETLSNKKLSSQAAFALVDENNFILLDKLEAVYMKSRLPQQKQGIKLVLNLDQGRKSKNILQRLKAYDLMQEQQGREQ